MYKVSMVSLGCPKNQVDAEMMLYSLSEAGFQIGAIEAEADAIIVNTCGFIEEAKAEAIENILEAARYKTEGNCKALIVTGCLAERYRDDVTDEIPEVDVCVGIGKNGDIAKIVKDSIAEIVPQMVKDTLGIKDGKAKVEGGVIDSNTDTPYVAQRDYTEFLE